MDNKEYTVVRDQDGKPIARKEITSKQVAENVHGLIVNGTMLLSFREFAKMQEEAENLPDIETLTDKEEK